MCEYSPYASEVTAGKFRLITLGSASSLDHVFLIFHFMSQDYGNDRECAELIFPWPGGSIVSAHNLLASTTMPLAERCESHDRGYA